MRFATPLIPAVLIRRYKRFLADVRLADGQEVTAHVANPGKMTGLAEPGQRIWLEPNDDPKKKLNYGWRLVDHGAGHFTGVDTGIPNRLLRAALQDHRVLNLPDYTDVQPEVSYAQNSRVDFLLRGANTTYLEVKSATLCRTPGLAEFPDTVTARGAKHLADLTDMVAQGHKAVLFYVIQRTDCTRLTVAADIDPVYAAGFRVAMDAGVQVRAMDCSIDRSGIELHREIPFAMPN